MPWWGGPAILEGLGIFHFPFSFFHFSESRDFPPRIR
jgi:hypothetical protein